MRLLRRVFERVELARERAERCVALLWILGEGAAHDRLERRAAREAVSPERERREIDDVMRQLLAREPQARVHTAREQQIEQRGKRVLLRGGGQLRRPARKHGAGVLGRAQGVEARAEQGGRRGVRGGCREREVDQTDGTIDVNEHVARVDLAVEDAALMKRDVGARDAAAELERLRGGAALAGLRGGDAGLDPRRPRAGAVRAIADTANLDEPRRGYLT